MSKRPQRRRRRRHGAQSAAGLTVHRLDFDLRLSRLAAAADGGGSGDYLEIVGRISFNCGSRSRTCLRYCVEWGVKRYSLTVTEQCNLGEVNRLTVRHTGHVSLVPQLRLAWRLAEGQ